MLALALAVGLGQLLAVAVHAGTWWLRRHALTVIAAFGALCFVFALLLTFSDFGDLPRQDEGGPTQRELHAQLLTALWWFIAFCLGTSGLGFYHGLLLSRRCNWPLWIGATLAIVSEISIAVLIESCVLWRFAWQLSGRMSFSEQHRIYFWSSRSLLVTLVFLALFRPLFLKLLRAIFQTIKPLSAATPEATSR